MVFQLFFWRVVSVPVWWYGSGLRFVWEWMRHVSKRMTDLFEVRVWMKNLFVPMYGDQTFLGRSISFVVRLIAVCVLGAIVLVVNAVLCVLVLSYVCLLPIIVFALVYHGSSLFSLYASH